MAVFYRAVSLAELADIHRTGQLRSLPGTCEGKHMAVTMGDAIRWGEGLYSGEDLKIVRISIDDMLAARFMRWDHLDSIGPACFATIEELAGASVDEVLP